MDPVLKYPIISDQITRAELAVIIRELRAVLHRRIQGDVVELGCYEGTTSLFLQRVLQQDAPDSQLHVYDSFAGLPPKTLPDASPAGEQFTAGELVASKATLIKHFKQAGLRLPAIHKGWFAALSDQDLPPRIAFAFLDGDFYDSILTSLRLVWPRLQPGGRVVIDDYHTEALPGVRRAVNQWAKQQAFKVRVEASLAILTPT